MNSNVVVGNIGFSEGVHYWEVICPIFCNSIGKSETIPSLLTPCVSSLPSRLRSDFEPQKCDENQHDLGTVPVNNEANSGRDARPEPEHGELLAQRSHAQEEQNQGAEDARPHLVPLHQAARAEHPGDLEPLLPPADGGHLSPQVPQEAAPVAAQQPQREPQLGRLSQEQARRQVPPHAVARAGR